MSLPQGDIEKILQAGQLAKVKLYQTLIKKIRDGSHLSASELRALGVIEQELEAQAGDGDSPKRALMPNDAVKYLKISRRSWIYHVGKGHITQNSDGSTDREELDRFLAKYRGRKGQEESQVERTVVEEKILADLRYRIAKATREEILVEELKANLVPRDEIAREWASRVAEVTAGLSIFADRLPPLLFGKTRMEMRVIIRDEIRALREQYAREGRYSPAAAELVP